MYKINKQQGHIYCIAQENTANIYNNFKWGIICKNIESICCTPETNNIANQLDFSNTTP